jgi:transposase InsO family protein
VIQQIYLQVRDTLLLQTGWAVCDMSIWKSMKRLGIKGFMRKSKLPISAGKEHREIPNILNRGFHADKPLQKIVSDITDIKHRGRWFYLVCFLDLFNADVINYFNCIRPVRKLNGKPPVQFRTEQVA